MENDTIWDVKLWVLKEKINEAGLQNEWSKIESIFMSSWKSTIENYKMDFQNHKQNKEPKPNKGSNKYYVFGYQVM